MPAIARGTVLALAVSRTSTMVDVARALKVECLDGGAGITVDAAFAVLGSNTAANALVMVPTFGPDSHNNKNFTALVKAAVSFIAKRGVKGNDPRGCVPATAIRSLLLTLYILF
jgi:hypothetical protein